MVRVVCTNFQPPRSRHNSGDPDYIDRDLAKRAAAALTTHSQSRDTGDSEDVSYDSMCDSEGDHTEHTLHSEPLGTDENSNSFHGGEDIQRKRKQRRRERNKLSAQAYRQRRKEQEKAQQKVLTTLEEENKELLKKVSNLETEIVQFRTYWCSVSSQTKSCRSSPSSTPTPNPTPAPSETPTSSLSLNQMCNENNNCPPAAGNANMNLNCVNMIPVSNTGGFNMNNQQCAMSFVIPQEHHLPSGAQNLAPMAMRVP